MADAKVEIAVESKPIGFSGTKSSLRDLNKDVNATAKAADAAQKKLGDGNKELEKKLKGGIIALKDEQKNLASLTTKYNEAAKRVNKLDAEMAKLTKTQQKLMRQQAEGKDVSQGLDELSERFAVVGEAADKAVEKANGLYREMRASAKSVQSLQSALADTTKEAGGLISAMGRQKAALTGSTAATMAMNRANLALSQLMAGNIVGAFKSATSAVKLFTKAISTDPKIAGILAVATAIASVVTGLKEARKRAEEYREAMKWLEEFQAKKDTLRNGDFASRIAGLDDEQLKKRQKTHNLFSVSGQSDLTDEAEARAQQAADLANSQSWIGRIASKWGRGIVNTFGGNAKSRNEIAESLRKKADEQLANEQRAKEEADAIQKEINRREEEAKTKTEKADALAAKQKEFEDRQSYDQTEREQGKLTALAWERSDLQQAYNAEQNEEKQLELKKRIYELDKQIAELNDRETKAEFERQDAQDDWLRARKMAKATEEEQLEIIKKQIAELKKSPRNAQTEAAMRGLIDKRDAVQRTIEQKNAQAASDAATATADSYTKVADLWNSKQDFLHRNDTDAQKLRDTSKYLEEAKASGDTSAMLELMMAGEELAGNYEEPLTKKQQRSAARKAKRDERAAKWAARAFRRQARAIEADWKENKGSAEEAAKKLTEAAGGTASFEVKNGRLVKVEGTDRTNQLLNDILKALE